MSDTHKINNLPLPLFAALPNNSAECRSCLETGIWRKSSGEVVACPRCCQFAVEPSPAALVLWRAVYLLQDAKLWIDPQAFDLARILTHYTAENPCKRETLGELFFAEHPDAQAGDAERKIKKLIEILRRDWLLPVGSTKFAPAGHWIITTAAELHEWRRHAASAPVTQLATIYRVVRANRDTFAGQTDFDFAGELAADITAKINELEMTK